MKPTTQKVTAQLAAGIFGGTVIGIPSFVTLMEYGGNNGCWPFIDSLFGTSGYESCGSFGAIFGLLIGVILAITVISLIKIKNYTKTAVYLLIGAFIFPFIYGIPVYWPPFENDDILLVPPITIGFMLASTIPSLIVTGALNWRKIFKKK